MRGFWPTLARGGPEGMWPVCTEAKTSHQNDSWQGNGDLSPTITRNWIWPGTWKNVKADTPSEPPDKNSIQPMPGVQPCDVLGRDWESCTTVLNFWPTELWVSTFILFQASQFAVMCYDHNRKSNILPNVSILNSSILWFWNTIITKMIN